MRRDFINKIIAGTIISTTLCTLVPIKASAEWVNDYQNNWYYTQDGQKLTGWKKIEGQLYYFDETGKMQTGWITAGNQTYFLQNNGVLKIGWFKYDRNWYYSDLNGAIQTGAINIAGKVYIFDNNGIMKTSNTVIGGEFYTIGSDGVVAGAKVPTPDKEFDGSGNCVRVLNNTESKGITSPTYSSFNDVIKDQSVSDDDPNEGRTFKVRFKDSNGAELKTKSVKNGKTVDLYEPTKDGYIFAGWNSKSDGSGKSYESDDDIKVKEDINLYAQWSGDAAVHVDGIVIKGSSYVTVNKTTQLTVQITPDNATNKGVEWSVEDGTGKATIDSNGILTGVAAGTVKVKAVAKDKSKYTVTKEITVSTVDVTVPVSKITLGSKTGSFEITANGGTLQMTANVYPDNANNQNIKWSVNNIGGSANIDPDTGLITAISDGVVTVNATAQDGSGKVGSTTIKISGQSLKIPVTSVEISAKGGVNEITTDAALGEPKGTLQMNATILPATASNKAITWRVINGDDYARISSTGLITAKANGTATVQATVNETGMVSNTVDVKITGQSVKLTGIAINEVSAISGDTDFNITTTPAAASIKGVKWLVDNQTGSAEFANDTGTSVRLKPLSNGKVVLKAIATAMDGTTVSDTQDVVISGQNNTIYVTKITNVYGTDASGKTTNSIKTDDGTLEMHADIFPTYASTTSGAVTWTVIGSGAKIIPGTSKLQAVSNTNGQPVIVRASCVGQDGKIISFDGKIYISNQITQATSIEITPTTIAGKDPEVAVGGTLQMGALVQPLEATYQNVKWHTEGGTGTADIDPVTGILIGKSVGDVKVVATADNGTGMTKTQIVRVISPIRVTEMTIKSSSDTITSTNGTVQLSVDTITPDATNKAVTWTLEQAGDANTTMTGKASLTTNTNGATLKAISNGTVRVKATATDGSKIESTPIVITINQPIKATALILKGYTLTNGVQGTEEVKQITSDDGELQLTAGLFPTNATTTPAAVTWTVEPYASGPSAKAGNAIFANGITATTATTTGTNGPILKAISNGDVKVKATGTIEGSTVITGEYIVTLSGQSVPIIEIKGITTQNNVSKVIKYNTLQLTADINPTYADKPLWTVDNEAVAKIDTDGLLTGVSAGVVTVTAKSKDNGTIFATKIITVTES